MESFLSCFICLTLDPTLSVRGNFLPGFLKLFSNYIQRMFRIAGFIYYSPSQAKYTPFVELHQGGIAINVHSERKLQ